MRPREVVETVRACRTWRLATHTDVSDMLSATKHAGGGEDPRPGFRVK